MLLARHCAYAAKFASLPPLTLRVFALPPLQSPCRVLPSPPLCSPSRPQLQARPAATASMGDTSLLSNDALDVERVPALSDNYVWLLTDKASGKIAVVDPSEARPVIDALQQRKPSFILNTHHHFDHTGGNEELKAKYDCVIVGPKADKDRIPGIDVALDEGETFDFGQLKLHVLNTPGHTRGHITFHVPEAEALFPGDTLFALGCGRLFEGTPQQMWISLSKFLGMPPQTRVFCAHEYTQSNAKFAVHVDPENPDMQSCQQEIAEMRSKGLATVPTLLGSELRLNPFLRPGDAGIRKALGIPSSASDVEAFTAIRKAKDNF